MADSPPRPVNQDIVIAKLAPGQGMEMELHCEKGIGKDHAKFSPVATATYRLLPLIEILKPIPEPLIPKFISCFPEGVIHKGGENGVYVADARKDTVTREVLRYPEFEGYVRLGRIQDHFLCKYILLTYQLVSSLQECMSRRICFQPRLKFYGKKLHF